MEAGHPWIFQSDIVDLGHAQPGEAVRVLDPRQQLLGTAHFSSTSQIQLRFLSRKEERIDEPFLTRRIEAALRFRQSRVRNSEAYRLVYGEADGLPGLVVDRYGDCLAVQLLSQGMDGLAELILDVLTALIEPSAIVLRNDSPVRGLESLPLEKRVVRGELPPSLSVRINDLSWAVDLLEGQKTGIFLDQRENYVAAAQYGHGKALDCFTCQGGFALHLAARCTHVEAVDSSSGSLAALRANCEANGITNVEAREADVFDLLSSHSTARRLFDLVVLDPPAFAKNRRDQDAAMRGYRDINLRALRLLGSGGILVTCSCSHHVTEADMLAVVADAAVDTGKTLRVLELRTQSVDHPVLLTVPETHYLKCIVLQVV